MEFTGHPFFSEGRWEQKLWIAFMVLVFACGGCGGDDGGGGPGTETETGEEARVYAFESDLVEGAGSTNWSGQAARQVLIEDVKAWIGTLTEWVDGGTLDANVPGDIYATLDFYVSFDGESNGDGEFVLLTKTVSPLQSTYDDISTGKKLIDKLAGNDSATDHAHWGTSFSGWTDEDIAASGGSISSPEGLLNAFLWTIDANAIARANGEYDLPVHLTARGQDLQQLVGKFLVMAVNFSQGTDDYLDDDVAGKGIHADVGNVEPEDEGKPYTRLEHHWDEGFGYFGAAADYGSYGDDEIAAKGGDEAWQGSHDTNDDGAIDLTKEFNFGASVNAAKRDLGSAGNTNPTDFTGEVFGAFHAGRSIIHDAAGDLTEEERTALTVERDAIRWGWEACVSATAIHYINDLLEDIASYGSEDPAIFAGVAKHWSELKGFSLGFQFNPASPVSDEDFASFHQLIGDSPILADAGEEAVTDYVVDLETARDLLCGVYGFDEENCLNW